MVGEAVTECPGTTACDCSKCSKSCRVRKLLELKHGLTIYHAPHSVTNKRDDDVMSIRPAHDNIIIIHNSNEDDVTPEDVLPEFDINTVRCPRCRYVMTRARAVLKAVQVVERKSIKCFCDFCDLEQLSRRPCRFCQRVIKQFEDIKIKDKEIKQELESLLADTAAIFVKKEESMLLTQYKKKKLSIRSLDKVFSSNELYDEKRIQTTDKFHKTKMSSILKSPSESETQIHKGHEENIVHSESMKFIKKSLQTTDKLQKTRMLSIMHSDSIEDIEKQTTDVSYKNRMSSIVKSSSETQARQGRHAKIVHSGSIEYLEKRSQTTDKLQKNRMSSILKSPLETPGYQGRQGKTVHTESIEVIEKPLNTTDKSHKTKMSSIFKSALETQVHRGQEAKRAHSESILGIEKRSPTTDKSHKTRMSSILKSPLETKAHQVSNVKKVHRSESIIGIGTGGMRVLPSELDKEKFMFLFPAKSKKKKYITVSDKSSHQIVQDTKYRLRTEIKREAEKYSKQKDKEKKKKLEKEQKGLDADKELKKQTKGQEDDEPDKGKGRDKTEKGSDQIIHKGTKKTIGEDVSTRKDSYKLHGKHKEHVTDNDKMLMLGKVKDEKSVSRKYKEDAFGGKKDKTETDRKGEKKDKDAHDTKSKGKGKKKVDAELKDISTSMTDNQATETSGVGTSFAGTSTDDLKSKSISSDMLEKEVDLLNKVLSKQEKDKPRRKKPETINKSKKEEEVNETRNKQLLKQRQKKTKIQKIKKAIKKPTKRSSQIEKVDDIKEESSGDESHKMHKIQKDKVRQSKIAVYNKSRDDLILKLIAKYIKPLPKNRSVTDKVQSEGPRKIIKRYRHVSCGDEEDSSDTDHNIERETSDVIVGVDIVKQRMEPPHSPEPPSAFHSVFIGDLDKNQEDKYLTLQPDDSMRSAATPGGGPVFYRLSDRKYIRNGWTVLPVEKVIRKMNVYRMRPSHPEFDWFEYNKEKGSMLYDTGEKLADFTNDNHGRWYYKNGKLALDFYASAGTNSNQRFVIYSSGEPDVGGRARPITVLGMFDYMGNGIVLDHNGKTRLKYNQTEGMVIDREIGPGCHWLWHSLNEPPELQQVMIDSQLPFKDPKIYRYEQEEKPPDDENMLSIEFNNYIKNKSTKVTEKFKPYQIKMKALKINKQFSLRVLDQRTIYLFFRDGPNAIRLNLGMILDHNEIVETSISDLGDVSIDIEKQPAATESLVNLQLSLKRTRLTSRLRTERELRMKPAPPGRSADNLFASASIPDRSPLLRADRLKNFSKCNIAIHNSLYSNTRLI